MLLEGAKSQIADELNEKTGVITPLALLAYLLFLLKVAIAVPIFISGESLTKPPGHQVSVEPHSENFLTKPTHWMP